MLADGLTKDKMEPSDLLRSCVRAGLYQISPEDHVLAQQAAERATRAQHRTKSAQVVGRDLGVTDFSKGERFDK